MGRHRLGGREPGGRVRLALASAACSPVAIALLSPLDSLAHRLFVAHMVQHMLLIAAFYADASRPPASTRSTTWSVGGLIDMIAVLALVHRAMGPAPTRAPALTPPGA